MPHAHCVATRAVDLWLEPCRRYGYMHTCHFIYLPVSYRLTCQPTQHDAEQQGHGIDTVLCARWRVLFELASASLHRLFGNMEFSPQCAPVRTGTWDPATWRGDWRADALLITSKRIGKDAQHVWYHGCRNGRAEQEVPEPAYSVQLQSFFFSTVP